MAAVRKSHRTAKLTAMPPPGFVKCTLGRGEDGDPAVFFSKMKGYAHADMCELPELTKPAILDCLRQRFEGELVYTYVGDIVCSVNPFKNVGCVGKAIRARYRGAQRHTLPPHIYTLVDMCYTKMMAEQQSQSILISGESGAIATRRSAQRRRPGTRASAARRRRRRR